MFEMKSFNGAEKTSEETSMKEANTKEKSKIEIKDMISILIAAGSEKVIHVVCVVPSMNEFRTGGIMPAMSGMTEGILSFFRHKIAFRMQENEGIDFMVDKSRKMLVEGLTSCYIYNDGQHYTVREPYKR